MNSLTGTSSLPLIRLDRHGGRDLVFRGEMLALAQAVLPGDREEMRVTLVLYKSQAGKFILSISVLTDRHRERHGPSALCFSCLADVWEYLGTEHPGLETVLETSLFSPSLAARVPESSERAQRMHGPKYARDCARCAESFNCAGRYQLPAGRPYPRRSCS